MSLSAKQPWKKNLYDNKEYPDNYTDVSFLQNLRKNIHIQDVTYRGAFIAGGRVSERLSIVTLFSVIFFRLYNEMVEPQTVFVSTSLAAGICYIIFLTSQKSIPVTVTKDSKTVAIFLVFSYIFSPVLKTLTETISTDTIFATTGVMMLVHLVFCDYGAPAAIVSKSLSLNAAIFASICLASRLQTSFHAFVLLSIAAEMFVLVPYFINLFVKPNLVYYSAIVSACIAILGVTSLVMCVLFILVTIFVNVIFPLLFVKWQSCKDNIYGPWDEAVVKDNDL